MSKLYKKYCELKRNNSEKLYLFKSGIFYILLDNDAKLVSEAIQLKLTKLNDTVFKCGFPVSSLLKYTNLLKEYGFDFEIIDNNLNINISNSDYINKMELDNKLNKIKNIDINNTSPIEAFNILCDFKSIL